MSYVFVVLAAAFSCLSVLTYFMATLRGEAQPNRVTWLLWALSPLIAAAAQFVTGVGVSTLNIVVCGLLPLSVFLVSFVNKNAYWRVTYFDYGCGAFSLLALVMWGLTRDPLIAVILCIVADFLAGIPTLRKSILHPKSENRQTYLIGIVAQSFGVLSVTDHSLIGYAFQVYLLGMVIVFSLFLYRDIWKHRVSG